jgi:hypothetical protein
VQALRELLDNPARRDWDKLVAASRTLIKAIETGQSARRVADVIMIDRNAAAAAEIATLRQKLMAAEARILEMADTDNAFKRLTSTRVGESAPAVAGILRVVDPLTSRFLRAARDAPGAKSGRRSSAGNPHTPLTPQKPEGKLDFFARIFRRIRCLLVCGAPPHLGG